MWLRGSTTWQNLSDDLVKLACGEIADGAANTVPLADRWRRSVVGQNHLRPPATQDRTLTADFRSGYFALLNFGQVDNANPLFYQSVCRVTNVYTTAPTSGQVPTGRWAVSIQVNTGNSVPGNYSGMTVEWQARDLEANVIWVQSNVSINASGVGTVHNGLQITVSDPSGLIKNGTYWVRAFTTTYLGGVDFWGQPYAAFSTGNATVSGGPSGTAGTDYDANVRLGSNFPTTAFSSGNGLGPISASQIGYFNGLWYGMGVKTNDGIGGSQYSISYPAAPGFWMRNGAGANNGQVFLDRFCGIAADNGGTYRRVCGWSSTSYAWMLPFTTPGSVDPAAQVQYWMSVKADAWVIILNGNPAYSGQSACNWITKFEPYNPEVDLFPWFLGPTYQNNRVGGTWRSCVSLVRFQDGGENRDWQTHWGRSDLLLGPTLSMPNQAFSGVTSEPVMEYGGHRDATGLEGSMGKTMYLVGHGVTSAIRSSFADAVGDSYNATYSEKPSDIDGKWWLLGAQVIDLPGNAAYSATSYQFPRGRFTNKAAFFIPESNWASGDEITDGVSGDTYFLIGANDHRIFMKTDNQGNNPVGGAAVGER